MIAQLADRFESWLWSVPRRYHVFQMGLLLLLITAVVPIVAAGACVIDGLKRYYATDVWRVDMTPTETLTSLIAVGLFLLVTRLYYRYIL